MMLSYGRNSDISGQDLIAGFWNTGHNTMVSGRNIKAENAHNVCVCENPVLITNAHLPFG